MSAIRGWCALCAPALFLRENPQKMTVVRETEAKKRGTGIFFIFILLFYLREGDYSGIIIGNKRKDTTQ